MTGFDQLERQLKASVKARGQGDVQTAKRRGWLGQRRTLAAILAIPLVVGGVAAAAGSLSGPEESSAQALVSQVVKDTSSVGPCRLVDLRRPGSVVNVAPAGPIADLFRAGPHDARALRLAREQSAGAAVLAGSPHILSFGNAQTTVLVFATVGTRGSVVEDATGCGQVREQRLAEVAQDATPSVRHEAQELLRARRDSDVAAQALNVQVIGGDAATFGASVPVERGVEHPTGVIAHDDRTYVGLAARGAATVDIIAPASTTVVRVRDGVFAARIDGGRANVRHIAADGTVIRSETIQPGDR